VSPQISCPRRTNTAPLPDYRPRSPLLLVVRRLCRHFLRMKTRSWTTLMTVMVVMMMMSGECHVSFGDWAVFRICRMVAVGFWLFPRWSVHAPRRGFSGRSHIFFSGSFACRSTSIIHVTRPESILSVVIMIMIMMVVVVVVVVVMMMMMMMIVGVY